MFGKRLPSMLLVAGLVALFCLAPGAAWAALPESDRAEQWEFYIPLNYVSSETHGADGGTTVALDSDLGIGFGFGYNFSEYFFLAFDLSFISIDFDARVIEEDAMMNQTVTQVRGNLDSSTFQVRGQYNFMARTFTPFVRAGLGSTFIDSNIPDGPPTGSCWWHPFWGQICGAWQPTHDDTVFSYSAGVGLRWELTDTFYTELSANRLWIDVDVGDSPELDSTRFQFGWLF